MLNIYLLIAHFYKLYGTFDEGLYSRPRWSKECLFFWDELRLKYYGGNMLEEEYF
jgi:hypothetical protein